MTHSPFVVIIILNWNNLRDVIRCLESIHHHDYLNFKVIVVDNGSETKPDQYIHEKFPDVEMVSSHKNLGYTGGNNLGIIKGLELQAEYFWLLNGDAIATRDCLSLLIEYAETHKEAGLISPVICSSTDNNQILYCGSYIDFENQYGLTAKKIEDIKVWQDMEPKRIALWGTALLIPKRVVEVVGYLNDKLFAYYEDMDYSARVIKAGFENKVVTDAKVFHRSEGNPNRKSYYYFYIARNEYIFWMDHLKEIKQKYLFIWRYIRKIGEKAITLGKEGSFEAQQALLSGAWCALKHKYGEWDQKILMPPILQKLITFHPYFWTNLMQGNFRVLSKRPFIKGQME